MGKKCMHFFPELEKIFKKGGESFLGHRNKIAMPKSDLIPLRSDGDPITLELYYYSIFIEERLFFLIALFLE